MSDSDSDSDMECPLCVEPLDISDRNFLPCPCGYRVCMWCWHNIRENLNGLCPACRSPYNADPHAFASVDQQDLVRKQKERRLKEKQEKKSGTATVSAGVAAKGVVAAPIADRKHLHNYRVIQRNLVYVIGVPVAASTEEILRRPEYFGQYGRIGKIVVHGNRSIAHATVSVYITFAYKEDAKAAIQVLDGFWFDGHHLRASFGTTKYCNNFIRGVPCNNPECVYLHDIGEDEDRFTKEEIQAGHSKLIPAPGSDQTIVTGNGGPSGTGKRPVGETVLPAPVFIQDIGPSSKPLSKPLTWPTSAGDASYVVLDGSSGFIESPPILPALGGADALDALPPLPLPPAAVSLQPPAVAEAKRPAPAPVPVPEVKEPPVLPAPGPPALSSARLVLNTYTESEVALALRSRFNEGRSEALRGRSLAAAFNGLGTCAVFPVPESSLAVSVWNDILNSTTADLCVNPYGLLELPVSELLELTLPPVDAAGSSAWPKPLQHYSRGMRNGATAAPAGRYAVPPAASRAGGREGKTATGLEHGSPGGAPKVGASSPSSKIEAFQQVFPSVKVHRSAA